MILTIACDMDGVISDLEPAWLARYNKDYGDTLTPEQITDWDLTSFVKPACGRRIFDYLTDPTLYEEVKPYADAQQGVQNLRKLGHNVIFTTACTFGMVDGKAHWLVRYGFTDPQPFSRLPYDLVAIQDKAHIRAHLMIDDGPHNVTQWLDTGRPAILVQRPHNERFIAQLKPKRTPMLRVAKTWADINALVKGIVDWAPTEVPTRRR